MKDILLTSAEFVKSATNISDNINDKVMKTAIREAQDINFKSVVGSKMYNKLKELVDGANIQYEKNAAYKNLLDEAQYYLAYLVVAKLCVITTYGLDNVGLFKKSDEHMESVDWDDVAQISAYYQHKADSYCLYLQNYILEHRKELPEIDENKCHEIRANLYSAASSGLWMGGVRGKGYGHPHCYIGK